MEFLTRNFARFGVAGSALVAACSLLAALAYSGRAGERFSLLNHFVSELGEVGVSPLAWLFNLGLIAGGLLILSFSIGLGLALPGISAKLGMLAGIVTAVSLAGVGLFPMNNLDPHVFAAMTYFRLGLVTVFFFGIAVHLQPRGSILIDRRANLVSLLAFLSYAAFLIYIQVGPSLDASPLDPSWQSSRPEVWPLAVLEWVIFFSTLVWFFTLSALKEAPQSSPNPPA
jgi:hypothetical membrane protein